jgi:hypothetical protein
MARTGVGQSDLHDRRPRQDPADDRYGRGVTGVGNPERGTHLCALYSGPVERDDLLMPFVQAGLREGDKCLCLIDQVEAPGGASATG